ncbi:MAG TPA: ATP-binding protein, partial [Gemmatimonadales bacterium]|nr:ATP-binding protein [Gemmatimonadales bacterium]
TALVLANVATGVVALDPDGAVLMANARARQLLGAPLEPEQRLDAVLGSDWSPLLEQVREFLAGEGQATAREVEAQGRTYRVQLARLGEDPGGVVLAVDDLTDVTQAARVLAWGEMARQVAHEIKNPLTPIRLGVQHLQRVRRERPDRFDQTLAQTSARILAEIDRLDTIARAFSRFGLPGADPVPLEGVDLGAAAREVAALYHLAGDGSAVEVTGRESVRRPARIDELKEVLGNLVENARTAGARRVTIRIQPDGLAVSDDGPGIPADQLPRIFEPRFSTTTSGAGLGLPIVRRLVESWGARVEVESEEGRGTVVSVRW